MRDVFLLGLVYCIRNTRDSIAFSIKLNAYTRLNRPPLLVRTMVVNETFVKYSVDSNDLINPRIFLFDSII